MCSPFSFWCVLSHSILSLRWGSTVLEWFLLDSLFGEYIALPWLNILTHMVSMPRYQWMALMKWMHIWMWRVAKVISKMPGWLMRMCWWCHWWRRRTIIRGIHSVMRIDTRTSGFALPRRWLGRRGTCGASKGRHTRVPCGGCRGWWVMTIGQAWRWMWRCPACLVIILWKFGECRFGRHHVLINSICIHDDHKVQVDKSPHLSNSESMYLFADWNEHTHYLWESLHVTKPTGVNRRQRHKTCKCFPSLSCKQALQSSLRCYMWLVSSSIQYCFSCISSQLFRWNDQRSKQHDCLGDPWQFKRENRVKTSEKRFTDHLWR